MKKLISISIVLSVCVAGSVLMTSCYAFMKAEKLIYSGSMAKQPVSTIIVTDSTAMAHD